MATSWIKFAVGHRGAGEDHLAIWQLQGPGSVLHLVVVPEHAQKLPLILKHLRQWNPRTIFGRSTI